MNEFLKKYNKMIPTVLIVLLVVLGLSVIFSLYSVGGKKNPKDAKQEVDTEIGSQLGLEGNFLGVIKDINDEINAISIMDISGDSDMVLYYNGGTNIRDKFGKLISMTQMDLGEIVDVYYEKGSNKVVKLQISKDAWEYKGVENFKIKNSNKVMEIADSKYRFNDRLVIAGGETLINLIEINEKDELTVKGINEEIRSIIITKGHGYIRLRNYEDFLEGSIEVGYHIILPIVKDMLIVAREGDYKVTLEKGNIKGSKHINVMRDQEIVLDMSEYRKEPEKKGNVDFLIQPYGATLYIDGEEVDYEDPVELLYGNHVVRVSLVGYETYAGMLDVNESSKVVEINLAQVNVIEETNDSSNQSDKDVTILPEDTSGEETKTEDESKDVEDKDDQTKEEVKDTDESDENNNGETKDYDTDHTISMKQPIGAEIYLNGILKGIVPCSFTKEIGIHTVTFRRNGYVTKSYTVEVTDDARDINFSFPEMSKLQ